MRIEKTLDKSSFEILSGIISASTRGKKISIIGTSFGYSFLMKVGNIIENTTGYSHEWSFHVFDCEWSIIDAAGKILKKWDGDANLDDVAAEIVGSAIADILIRGRSLSIITSKNLKFEIDAGCYEESEPTDDDSSSLLTIEYQRAWAMNFEADSKITVDIASP